MRNTLLLILIFLLACSPENEKVKDEQVDVGPPAEALDSVANTRTDAVETDEDVTTTPTLPLPQPVLQLLAQKYPGFQQPTLAEAARKQAEGNTQGPIIVRGDFTNDAWQDYALQLQQDKNLLIIAVTDTGGNNWTVHELKRDILFNERGTLKSLYYLYLAEPGKALQDAGSGEKTELKNEAVAVGLEDNITTYVYSNNGFKGYQTVR